MKHAQESSNTQIEFWSEYYKRWEVLEEPNDSILHN